MPASAVSVLAVEGLSVDRGGRRVLRDVTLEVRAGEMLGLVGGSGAGKSTLAHAALRLVEPAAGRIFWRGRDVSTISERALRPLRRDFQIVFQQPAHSLDPRHSVARSLAEPLRIQRLPAPPEALAALLREVGLGPELLRRRPHQLSSGQAQRVALARALSTRPALLVADEALSALDASVRAQMANLLGDLRASLGFACLLVTHDLRLAAHLCDRVAVLADGELVEVTKALSQATHPRTRALIAAAEG